MITTPSTRRPLATGLFLLGLLLSSHVMADTWVPQANSSPVTLRGVWGSSANSVWAVGGIGTIRKWDGTSWTAQTSGTTDYFRDVWGTDASNVWAVADNGTIRKWNGSAWNLQYDPSPSPYALEGVWGSAANSVWAVGENGTILKYDGTSWTINRSDASQYLIAVWGADANNIWAVGQNGLILKWNGSTWTSQASTTTNQLNAVWGTAANNVWAVGQGGTILKYDGTSWTAQTSGTSDILNGVWGSAANNVRAVGNLGRILKCTDGSTWTPETSGTGSDLHALWGTDADNIWAVGSGGGTILKWTLAPTVTTTAQGTVTATTAVLGGNVTADGGAAVTDRGIVWATTANPTTANNKVANGSGTGTFSATVSGLTSSATIHVRAYAINSAATSYGTEISFATPAANSAPLNTVPGSKTVNEDTALNITGLSVNDANGNLSSTALSVSHGTLTVSLTGGATISAGANPSAALTLSGTQAQINAALGTVSYKGALNYFGSDTLTVRSTDSNAATDSDNVGITVSAVNDAPTISDITDQSTNEDIATAAITFTVGDVDTAAASLTLSGTSSNTALVPNVNIVLGGSGANRTVTLTPAPNQSGTATIKLTVSDGNKTDYAAFDLTVNDVNDAPTLADIADPAAINEDAGAQTVNLSGITAGGGETQTLTVTATSSNPGLIPDPTVTYTSPDTTGTLAYTPKADANGSAEITVTVNDGQPPSNKTFQRTFTVTVTAVNDAPSFVLPAGVSTLAGKAGQNGPTDATGAAARFNFPYGVAVDSAGNVFVADTNNHTIRKITPAGNVSTLAGAAGEDGSTDGTGADARFDSPRGVAVDSAGNVYVADYFSNTIRKITLAGAVSTLAGTAGQSGSADGTGDDARFNRPYGVAVDSAGYVYVADSKNYTIRKITPTGVVSTLAGSAREIGNADGTGDDARFNYPYAVAVDSAGNVFVADTNNDTIRKVTPSGVVSTLAGKARQLGNADGAGDDARFKVPQSVAVDSAGNVYVADSGNHTIRKITSAGEVRTLAGKAEQSDSTDGTGTNARFSSPTGVAVDSAGNLYVADRGNQTIRKIKTGVQVKANSRAFTRADFATGISPGPANEKTQAVTFTVTNNNEALFTVQPAIAPDGTLTFTPASGKSGQATVTVRAKDNGPDTLPNVNTSAPQTFLITVAAVRPTVSINTPTITSERVRVPGNVTNDGGAAITERGVVYSLKAINKNPRINGKGCTKITTNGTTGKFNIDILNLAPGKTYSVRAYATNRAGTAYSRFQYYFTIPPASPLNKALAATSASTGTAFPGSIAAAYASEDSSLLQTSTSKVTVDGQKYLTLTVVKPPGKMHFTGVVEVSGNLTDWYSGNKHTTLLRDDANLLKVRDNTPLTPGTKRYIRLK